MTEEVLEQIKFRTGKKNTFTIDGMEFIIEERTTLVRMDSCHELFVELDCGGWIEAKTWQYGFVEKYETHPEGAIRAAYEEYGDDYEIAGIREVDPDGDLSTYTYANRDQIDADGWISVDPERDLPDE